MEEIILGFAECLVKKQAEFLRLDSDVRQVDGGFSLSGKLRESEAVIGIVVVMTAAVLVISRMITLPGPRVRF